MTGRQSGLTDKALALIGKPRKDGKPHTAYSAAKQAGIHVRTIYRAIERAKNASNS